MAERIYAMRRVRRGVYLLRGNDGESLWLIRSYVDGPSAGLVDWPRDRTVWEALRWEGYRGVSMPTLDDILLDQRGFSAEATALATRREAINYVVNVTASSTEGGEG